MASLIFPDEMAAVPPATVLLADSDDDARNLYGDYLRQSSVIVDEARDGREALAKALASAHDAVITETRLPGINGYELCEVLRRDTATRATVIMAITGDALAPNLDRARRAGADVVLVKPCLPDVLVVELRRLLTRSAELRRHSAVLSARTAEQLQRSQDLQARTHHRALSRQFVRQATTAPPMPAPALVCPVCDRPLLYARSHIGGVSERHREQWDYYECPDGCGTFQYRHRTRKLRKVA